MYKSIRVFICLVALIHLAPLLVMCCGDIVAFPSKTEKIQLSVSDQAFRREYSLDSIRMVERSSFQLHIWQEPNDSLFAPLDYRSIALKTGLLNNAMATTCDENYSYFIEHLESIEISFLYDIGNYKKDEDITDLFVSIYPEGQSIESSLLQKSHKLDLMMPVIPEGDSLGIAVEALLSDGRILKSSTSVLWKK